MADPMIAELMEQVRVLTDRVNVLETNRVRDAVVNGALDLIPDNDGPCLIVFDKNVDGVLSAGPVPWVSSVEIKDQIMANIRRLRRNL